VRYGNYFYRPNCGAANDAASGEGQRVGNAVATLGMLPNLSKSQVSLSPKVRRQKIKRFK
jgi:hypothetical protein